MGTWELTNRKSMVPSARLKEIGTPANMARKKGIMSQPIMPPPPLNQ